MTIDTFPPWVPRVRKDPLGSVGYNRLLERFRWGEMLFAKEHLLADAPGGQGFTGEHNAPEIPREVGSIYTIGGPALAFEGFRYATGVNLSATGTAQLNLDNSVYPSVDQMALQVQNCSESGLNKPCITTAKFNNTGQVELYSKYLTSALGAANAWAVENANICVAVHGPKLPGGLSAIEGIAKLRADWLTQAAADWNAQVQVDATLRAKFLVDLVGPTHTTAGVHVCREVGRTWADIYWDSGVAYRIRDTSSRNPCNTVTRVGLGHVRLTFSAWTLSAQPFVMTNFAASNSGLVTDIIVSSTPRSLITTTTIDVFLYKYDAGAMTWARYDADFFIVVHAGT